MAKIFTFIILFVSISFYSTQAQELVFQYDNAGNQTVRRWVCINCPPPYTTASKAQDLSLTLNGVIEDSPKRGLSVYPNPLKEQLNIEWWADDKEFIQKLEVFTLNGVRIFFKNHTENERQSSFSFLELAAGTYLLRATYSTNRFEIIQVIKQ